MKEHLYNVFIYYIVFHNKNTFKILLRHGSITRQFTSAMENNFLGKRSSCLSYPGKIEKYFSTKFSDYFIQGVRNLRHIHLRNRMITAEDTAHRTPAGLANLRISSQTVRRRLREYGLRARYPVVGPILDQHHRIVRIACAYAHRRWRLHAVVGGFTWQHILLVMNPDIHFISAMEDIICTAGVGNV